MSVDGFEAVIGLEVHCQLATSTKMFSACAFRFGEPPNSLTDPYTWGLPGTLPVVNQAAVRAAVSLALAVGAKIHGRSRFARKHYFYPDLPKGYQITQSDHPYCTGGTIEVPDPAGEGSRRTVRLTRIHMEEDAGKNVHVAGEDVSLVDYNRAGAPLVEIVSEPDLRSASEAADYLRELRAIIRTLGISDANMERGTLRCDANVSLRPVGTQALGTRCEIKNLNSFRFLEAAIDSEIRRQADLLSSGGTVVQSTLSYDVDRDQTKVMRTKEEAADYRYFPDPDLPPLVIPGQWIAEAKSSMPPLPSARREHYRTLGLGPDDVRLLGDEPGLGRFFAAILETGAAPRAACTWLTVELLGRLNADARNIDDSPVSAAWIGELIALVADGSISGRTAKEVFASSYADQLSPRQIVDRDGLRQVSDTAELEQIIKEVMASGTKQLEQYRQGRVQLRGWFVGQVMKRTKGQANPQVVQQLLDGLLPPVES